MASAVPAVVRQSKAEVEVKICRDIRGHKKMSEVRQSPTGIKQNSEKEKNTNNNRTKEGVGRVTEIRTQRGTKTTGLKKVHNP